jgi:DNA invertase Pin-like site-specific DNA recombinase
MIERKVSVAVLVRVSTVKQETARQISELQQYAVSKGYEVLEICQETISGTAGDDQRHGLRRAEQLAREGKIKKVLVHEISRIARRNSVAHRFVETLEDYRVSLYWHAQGVETLLPNGKRNPAAGIMLALLAEIARNESETLRDRIKSGLALARKRGVVLGRRKGTTLSRDQFLQKHKDIVRQLKARQSLRNTAKIVGKGISTVQRVKVALAAVTAPSFK